MQLQVVWMICQQHHTSSPPKQPNLMKESSFSQNLLMVEISQDVPMLRCIGLQTGETLMICLFRLCEDCFQLQSHLLSVVAALTSFARVPEPRRLDR